MYSQSDEQLHILKYFRGITGHLLSIGENDGKTLSNALALIELGWSALLVEPGEISFNKLKELHKDNPKVDLMNVAISDKVGTFDFYESEVHKPLGEGNHGLLSTLDKKETMRWRGSETFNKKEVECIDYKTLKELHNWNFDFITIDAEGLDLAILKQISLTHTSLLCIEHNSVLDNKRQILEYCKNYGMKKVIYESYENILISK
jgi:FkbM family methyltransferase